MVFRRKCPAAVFAEWARESKQKSTWRMSEMAIEERTVIEVEDGWLRVRAERVPDRYTKLPFWRLDVFEWDVLMSREWDYRSGEDAARWVEEKAAEMLEVSDYANF
jgi:hypothetical protein